MDQYQQFSDEALVALVSQGEVEAEELLVWRFSRVVKQNARPLFLAGGDSEDLTQEGMLGLLAAIRSFSPDAGASFRTYAETCIRRRLLTAVKTAARQKHAPLNFAISFESSQFDETQMSHISRDLEEQVLAKEQVGDLCVRFSHILSGFENEILRLFLEGLSYQEMAEDVGKPVKSVDNAIQRIRKKLAGQFV